MSLANALKKAASKTLSKLGGDVTIRKVTANTTSENKDFDSIVSFDAVLDLDHFVDLYGSYNTTTGIITESTSDTTIKGAVSNVSRNQVNDLIESQDKLLTISAGDLTFEPTTEDRVVISSIEYKIIQVITNEQSNTAVSFDLILR